MTSTPAAMYLRAYHPKFCIPVFLNRLIAGRFVETRPACTAFKLGVTFKKQLSTTNAIVDPFFMIVPIGVIKRRFRSFLSRNPELFVCQLVLPFRICFCHCKFFWLRLGAGQ